ncbi:MAG: hypothetical protein ACI4FV_08220 [Lachnospiraceae bacterium]
MTIAVTGGVHRAAVTMTVVMTGEMVAGMIVVMIGGMIAGMIVAMTAGTTATDGTVTGWTATTATDGVVITAELIDHVDYVYGAASAAPILFLYFQLLVSLYFFIS